MILTKTYYIKQYMKKMKLISKVNLICKIKYPLYIDNLKWKEIVYFEKEMNNDLVVYAGGSILGKILSKF